MKQLLILVTLLIGSEFCFGQEFIDPDNFKDKTAKDIVVVEFYAGWNDANSAKYELSDCSYYLVDISQYIDLQIKFDITAIPTVVVFENGEEKIRFLPNVMFKLDADKNTVQKDIDKLMLAKFN
tara:strand:- start:2576 stop:2947 length:372 start_codon:yes stop_codon:yes gene_type:complete